MLIRSINLPDSALALFICEEMASNKSDTCMESEFRPLSDQDLETAITFPPKDPVIAFRLIPDRNLEWDKNLISFFHTLFDVVKVVPIRNEHPDQVIREVVLILSSKKNLDVLEQICFTVGDCKYKVTEIGTVEAEQVIMKSKTKLYIGNIPATADNSKIWRHFAKFGSVEYSCIVKKAERNLKGFGFVIFKDRESFEKALKNKHYVDGHRLVCKYFLNKTQQTRKSKDQRQESEEGYPSPAPHHCNQLNREATDIGVETQSSQDEAHRSDSSLGHGGDLIPSAPCRSQPFIGPYSSVPLCQQETNGLRFNVGQPAAYPSHSRVPT
jgi:RNA recognition motif. (a.k.a. RRM, RBD, or RNP domain)